MGEHRLDRTDRCSLTSPPHRGVNPKFFTGDLHYVDVVSPAVDGKLNIVLDAVKVDNETLPSTTTTGVADFTRRENAMTVPGWVSLELAIPFSILLPSATLTAALVTVMLGAACKL